MELSSQAYYVLFVNSMNSAVGSLEKRTLYCIFPVPEYYSSNVSVCNIAQTSDVTNCVFGSKINHTSHQ